MINEPLAHELLLCEYVGRKENVLLVGNPGTGKAHLASALAFADCALGRKVLFYTVTELVTELIECREERRLPRMQKQLQRLDLIVLDELGYTPFSKPGPNCCLRSPAELTNISRITTIKIGLMAPIRRVLVSGSCGPSSP